MGVMNQQTFQWGARERCRSIRLTRLACDGQVGLKPMVVDPPPRKKENPAEVNRQ